MGILNPRLVHQIFRGIWVAIILVLVGPCLLLYHSTHLPLYFWLDYRPYA